LKSKKVSGRDLKVSAEDAAHETLKRAAKKVNPKLRKAIEDKPGDMPRFIKGLGGQN
jgi:hypothetical protein